MTTGYTNPLDGVHGTVSQFFLQLSILMSE